MIEKIANLAEKLATHVSHSRRGFLTRAGQAALAAGAVLGFSAAGQGQDPPKEVLCCLYNCPPFHAEVCVPVSPTGCPVLQIPVNGQTITCKAIQSVPEKS